MIYTEIFNNKINTFSNHPKFNWLRKYANDAIDNFDNFANRLQQIKAEDFVERIISMPLSYIQDWLDDKNQLEWRKQDERYLQALEGCFLKLQEQHPNIKIHKIGKDSKDFYIDYLKFQLIDEDDRFVYVGEKDN